MNEIVYIPTNRIWAHPLNPRRELGDLTELTASVRGSGILQNLTVVKLISDATGEWDGESYRVVIGHRRLAAARKAGLTVVPCVVAELTEREQVAAMLAENMQRASLTYYEEAQGIQMMLDMGAEVSEVAKETGFSESTVRRRMTLLKFDGDKVKEGCSRGATLEDYAELDKIKDSAARDKVLSVIGTANFRNELARELETQIVQERVEHVIERLSEWAYDLNDYKDVDKTVVKTFYCWSDIDEDGLEPRSDSDSVMYFYNRCGKGSSAMVQLYKEEDEDEDDDEDERDAEVNRRYEELTVVCERHRALRREFIKSFSESSALAKRSVAASYAARVIYRAAAGYRTFSVLAELWGIAEADTAAPAVLRDDIDECVSRGGFVWKPLLWAVYAALESGAGSPVSKTWSNGVFAVVPRVSDTFKELYAFLKDLGYEVSDEELDILHGSHENFIN